MRLHSGGGHVVQRAIQLGLKEVETARVEERGVQRAAVVEGGLIEAVVRDVRAVCARRRGVVTARAR